MFTVSFNYHHPDFLSNAKVNGTVFSTINGQQGTKPRFGSRGPEIMIHFRNSGENSHVWAEFQFCV